MSYIGTGVEVVTFNTATTFDVTGNITVGGTVDGRDVATDGIKLDTVSTGAIANVVQDTTPQLGGALDLNTNNIIGTGNINVTGSITGTSFVSTGNMSFTDNNKALFGTGSDLQIYHDGSNSYIYDGGTGNLIIKATDIRIRTATDENYITATADGALSLYYDNNVKLATTSTGINVTGTVTADGLTISDTAPFINITDTDTGVDHQITGSSGVGNLSIKTDVNNEATDGDFFINTKTANRMRVQGGGDISFYDSTGVTQGLFWDASTQRLGLGTTAPGNLLEISGSSPILEINSTAGNPELQFSDGGVDEFSIQYDTGSNALRFVEGGIGAHMVIKDGGNVGIGTSSPTAKIQTNTTSAGAATVGLFLNNESDTINTEVRLAFAANANNDIASNRYSYISAINTSGVNGQALRFATNQTGASAVEAMRIDSSGNVGIGTSSPFSRFTIKTSGNGYVDGLVIEDADSTTRSAITHVNGITYFSGNTTADHMVLTSGGNVGIGATSPSSQITLKQSAQNFAGGFRLERSDNTNNFTFAIDGSTKLNIGYNDSTKLVLDSSGNVGIGTTSPEEQLTIGGGNGISIRTSYDGTYGALKFGTSSSAYYNEWAGIDSDNEGVGINVANLRFYTSYGSRAERMRIDSSGNLLVGKTSYGSLSGTGGQIGAGGVAIFTASSDAPLYLNRTTSDGIVIDFYKDGSRVGAIASLSGVYTQYTSTGGYTGLGGPVNSPFFYIYSSALYPTTDNLRDIGTASNRCDDIYATNGTIQTSDANEKQQIAALTDAEIAAAKAISGLFKTFKWNSAVEAKGDAARTHAGVIAQDVEAAMTAAGLDAGDYAFFISSTWWETQTEVPAVEAVDAVLDEDGNVVTEAVEAVAAYTRTDTYETAEEAPEGATQRNRKGIRYPELLAFIGAATEQRLTDIEARITALENN